MYHWHTFECVHFVAKCFDAFEQISGLYDACSNQATLMIIHALLLGMSVCIDMTKAKKNGLVVRYLLQNPCLDR